MAAGLGFKNFASGEVLTAADVNGYLMQGVGVFTDAANRDAEITSPQEGQFAYLKDTNVTTYYTGSAWANLDTTGMTNPMTTTGDTIYSSSGSTPARLGIGTAGQVLTVNSGATAPEWATPAGGGGKVLQVVSATYSTSTNIVSTTYTDTGLTASITPSAATSKVMVIVSLAFSNSSTTVGAKSGAQIVRASTSIANFGGTFKGSSLGSVSTGATGNETIAIIGLNYLDSPATTSSTTYKVQAASDTTASGTNCTAQAFSAVSTITLMEIGA